MNKRKWFLLISAVLAVVTLGTIGSVAVLAQDQADTTAARLAVRDALAIVAPRIAPVNDRVSIRVFSCADQEPVEGAGVWLIAPDKVETLKGEIAKLEEIDRPSILEESESLLNIHGKLIGHTDQSGRVWYSFDVAGRYLLAAVKPTFSPDIRHIAVGVKPPALSIEAPRRAEAGEKITVTVTARNNGEVVKDAGVWALPSTEAESLKADIAAKRGSSDIATIEAAIEEVLDIHGIFLGTTNGDGKVNYAFEDEGKYLLVAVKRSYLPAFQPIAVGVTPKVLVIDAPRRADIGEKITITTLERGAEDPVKDAGVWALGRTEAASLQEQIKTIRESGDRSALQATIENEASSRGIFLGGTNGSGQLHYAFENAGGYLLVTIKPGYFPGFRPIIIGAVPQTDTTRST